MFHPGPSPDFKNVHNYVQGKAWELRLEKMYRIVPPKRPPPTLARLVKSRGGRITGSGTGLPQIRPPPPRKRTHKLNFEPSHARWRPPPCSPFPRRFSARLASLEAIMCSNPSGLRLLASSCRYVEREATFTIDTRFLWRKTMELWSDTYRGKSLVYSGISYDMEGISHVKFLEEESEGRAWRFHVFMNSVGWRN